MHSFLLFSISRRNEKMAPKGREEGRRGLLLKSCSSSRSAFPFSFLPLLHSSNTFSSSSGKKFFPLPLPIQGAKVLNLRDEREGGREQKRSFQFLPPGKYIWGHKTIRMSDWDFMVAQQIASLDLKKCIQSSTHKSGGWGSS